MLQFLKGEQYVCRLCRASERAPRLVDIVWGDPAAPKELASVSGAGDHTSTCVLDCTFFYGSAGSITDAQGVLDTVALERMIDDRVRLIARFSKYFSADNNGCVSGEHGKLLAGTPNR